MTTPHDKQKPNQKQQNNQQNDQQTDQPNPETKKTYLINIISGPGAGKTTICALLFAKLKIKGYAIEYIQEVAKHLVWEEDFELLDNQYWVSRRQFTLLNCLQSKVDLIITDGCLLHGIYYNRFNQNNVSNVGKTEQFITDSFHKFNNINIFLERGNYPYEQVGRYQTEEEAKYIDQFFKTYLDEHKIPYHIFPVQEDKNIDQMVALIESHLK